MFVHVPTLQQLADTLDRHQDSHTNSVVKLQVHARGWQLWMGWNPAMSYDVKGYWAAAEFDGTSDAYVVAAQLLDDIEEAIAASTDERTTERDITE